MCGVSVISRTVLSKNLDDTNHLNYLVILYYSLIVLMSLLKIL